MWEERTEKQPVRAFVPRLQRIRIRRHCNEQSRTGGNATVGNGKEVLLAALTVCLPYIGFPRTLNALSCINEVLPEAKQ